MEKRMVVALADCPARRVPAGTPAIIPEGSFVTISQALGGSYTVLYEGNMLRIDGTDAAALGLEPLEIEYEDYGDGKVHLDQVEQTLQIGRASCRERV